MCFLFYALHLWNLKESILSFGSFHNRYRKSLKFTFFPSIFRKRKSSNPLRVWTFSTKRASHAMVIQCSTTSLVGTRLSRLTPTSWSTTWSWPWNRSAMLRMSWWSTSRMLHRRIDSRLSFCRSGSMCFLRWIWILIIYNYLLI